MVIYSNPWRNDPHWPWHFWHLFQIGWRTNHQLESTFFMDLHGEYWTICRNYPVCVARTFRCLEIQEKPAIYRVKPLYRRVKCLFGFVRGIFIHKILRFNLFPETRSSKTHVKMSMFCPCCFANVLRRLCYETLKKGLTMNYALQKSKTNKTPENQGVDT